MDFHGSGKPLNDRGMDQVCSNLKVSPPEIWAVLTVETRGFGFLPDRRPQILYERHIFHRLSKGKFSLTNGDVSNAKAGGYVGGAAEYGRLEKAIALDRSTALQSVSWGIGQVMGFNFKTAGFASVEEMVDAMIKDENAQLMAMANFVKSEGLDKHMQEENWVDFARGYNGSEFKKNEYDTRLAAAHAKCKVLLPNLALRTAQAALVYLGFDPGPVDGFRGKRTHASLLAFQEKMELPETGELDSVTEEKLLARGLG